MMSEYCGYVLEMSRIHEFGDHGQPARLPRLCKDLQALYPQALKGVWRRTRLVGAAAKHGRARGLGGAGGHEQLLSALHRAGSGDQGDVPPSQAGASDRYHSIGAPELAADQFVGSEDGQHLVHAGIGLERQAGDDVPLTHDGDDRHHVAGRHEAVRPCALKKFEDTFDVLSGRSLVHDDHHLCASILHLSSPGSEPRRPTHRDGGTRSMPFLET